MTADHWPFVIAAYGLVAFVLVGYWRRLAGDERRMRTPRRGRS